MAYFNKSEHFSADEFACKGRDCCGGKSEMDVHFMLMLESARYNARIAFRINSGWRCVVHNSAVGGKKTSSHLEGMAADIKADTPRQFYIIVTTLIKAGFTRIGIGKTFVHVDNDPNKNPGRIWPY